MDRSRDRVLFITGGSIGDTVLTAGLLRRFVECEPEALFTVAAGPIAVSLFLDTPRLEETIAIVKRRRALHWFELWRRVAGRRWKAVIDMRGSGLSYALRAERRFVYRPVRQGPGAPPLHKAQEAARTIGALDSPPSPFLYTSAAREARADELVGEGGPVLAVAPAATWPPKTWPAERFAEAVVELVGPAGPLAGGRALLTGGPGDAEFFQPIRAALPPSRLIDVVGLDLLTVYACLKRARLFIGNDSGPMHLSAAAGAPTLGRFGPSDDRLYRPWGPRTAFVRAEIGGRPAGDMTDLSVAAVVRAARDLVERTREGKRDNAAGCA
jgi:ADP-heptose:LPS heptosyltransferase